MVESSTPPPEGGGPVPRLGRPRDWLIGAALLVALVVAVWMTIGWDVLLAPWRSISPFLLLGAFVLTALSYGLRALRVVAYFRPRFDGCFPTVLRLSVLHNSANNLLPMRAGELVFPWLMRRYFGQGWLDSAASLLWIRVLDLHFLGLIGLAILALRDPSRLWLWLPLGALWLLGLALFVPLRRALDRRVPPSGQGGVTRVLALLRQIACAAPARPGRIASVYLWTALVWSLKFTAFAILLEHFMPVAFWRVLTGVMGAELSTVLPFHGIAGSGSYELAVVAALAPFGVDPKLALAGAVNLHLFLLGTTLILGALALLLPRVSPCAAPRPGRDRDPGQTLTESSAAADVGDARGGTN